MATESGVARWLHLGRAGARTQDDGVAEFPEFAHDVVLPDFDVVASVRIGPMRCQSAAVVTSGAWAPVWVPAVAETLTDGPTYASYA